MVDRFIIGQIIRKIEYNLLMEEKMTVSERIFKIIDEENMTQKEFSEKTGIPQSTISDWRKKNTNPASDKILIICEALKVTPYELLSGVKEEGSRSNRMRCQIIVEGTEENMVLELYDTLDRDRKNRLLGYLQAVSERG